MEDNTIDEKKHQENFQILGWGLNAKMLVYDQEEGLTQLNEKVGILWLNLLAFDAQNLIQITTKSNIKLKYKILNKDNSFHKYNTKITLEITHKITT